MLRRLFIEESHPEIVYEARQSSTSKWLITLEWAYGFAAPYRWRGLSARFVIAYRK